jgi:hypothetical protein
MKKQININESLNKIQTPNPVKERPQKQRGLQVVPISGQAFIPEILVPGKVRWELPSGVSVQYSKKVRKITLLRILLSRYFYPLESYEIKIDEVIVLYDLILELQDLCSKDKNFSEKFGITLEAISLFLRGVQFERIQPLTFVKNVREFLITLKDPRFIYPLRNLEYIQSRPENRLCYRLYDRKSEGTLKKFLPPKRFIGIGYRDKGTLKPEHEGSPHWTEVALILGREEENVQPYRKY